MKPTKAAQEIVHDAGTHWVHGANGAYTVMISGHTHSTADSSYDQLCIAIARCNYLAKRVSSASRS